MTDFPLLCKVLENYDSTKHVARIKRYDSCDLEISSKTTVSYLSSGSPDCEVLEQLIDSLKQEAGEKEMTPEVVVPEDDEETVEEEEEVPAVTALETKEDKRARMLDKFGYRLVDIEAISQKKERLKKEGMQHSQSADNIFDDPTYSSILANRDRHRMGSIPEYPVSASHMTEHSTKPSEASQEDIEAVTLSKSQSAADITAFDRKQRKMYMSLQNMMDIIDTKLPTDPALASQDTDDAYGPRVVPPPNHQMV